MGADGKIEIIREMLADPFKGRALTPREKEVAKLAALDGMTYREIAQALDIAEATARTHLQHVVAQLGVSKSGLINLFVEQLRDVVGEGRDGAAD